MQEPNDNGNQGKKEEFIEPKIIVTLTQAGDVKVEGNCLVNLPTAMFMLEMGRDLIKANGINKAAQQQKQIITANNKRGFRDFIKFGKR